MVVKIAILGGGVGGLSAAHELAERSGHGVDFEIHVFEKLAGTLGGKARSIDVPGSASGGRKPLPGEHGFRFFPGFYKHLPDTMKRIPGIHGHNVYRDLVVAEELQIARIDQPRIVIPARSTRNLGELLDAARAALVQDFGLSAAEASFFIRRINQLLTSCHDRRLKEYERRTWWEFLDAEAYSEGYRTLLANGLSRSLLANDPHEASLFTVGNTNIQLIQGLFDSQNPTDRLLNGPTSTVWIDPWRKQLEEAGVQFHMGHAAQRIIAKNGRISAVEVEGPGGMTTVNADQFIFAIPVERMAELLDRSAGPNDPLKFDPHLGHIKTTLRKNVRWMNGIQFFLRSDVPMCQGHSLHSDTPWALTCLSQAQFWPQTRLTDHGDGAVHGIISVCISEWNKPGLSGKVASQCSRTEIAEEVWNQLKRSLNHGGDVLLSDDNLHSWFLDPDIIDLPGEGVAHDNLEPLFVNLVDTWKLRPEAWTAIPNMFLASDYVRTHTDLASMEAANEAARRAVNRILTAAGSAAQPCTIWPLEESPWFVVPRFVDQLRFDQGLDWIGP